jgi:hypothetical protein
MVSRLVSATAKLLSQRAMPVQSWIGILIQVAKSCLSRRQGYSRFPYIAVTSTNREAPLVHHRRVEHSLGDVIYWYNVISIYHSMIPYNVSIVFPG